jgi:hypothetical protein
MRNLEEYPITKVEIIALLREMAMQADREQRVGDMTSLLLTEASKIVEASLMSPTSSASARQ